MKADCYFCHIKTVQSLLDKFKPEAKLAEQFIADVHDALRVNWDVANPHIATTIHRIAKSRLNNEDLYAEEKHAANSLLTERYSFWRNYIDTSANPLATAIRLAVCGNIIDYGAHCLKGDLANQIYSLLDIPLRVDKSAELISALHSAKSVLYLGDNAGEIFFDKLLLEMLPDVNITYVTRGFPVINDITLTDAHQMGIDKLCKVISNGYDAPSTLIDLCSDEFKEHYTATDLILSKGQGNFEGLMYENHPNTYFLLIAKCAPIAEMLGCKKNDMLVTTLNANNYAL